MQLLAPLTTETTEACVHQLMTRQARSVANTLSVQHTQLAAIQWVSTVFGERTCCCHCVCSFAAEPAARKAAATCASACIGIHNTHVQLPSSRSPTSCVILAQLRHAKHTAHDTDLRLRCIALRRVGCQRLSLRCEALPSSVKLLCRRCDPHIDLRKHLGSRGSLCFLGLQLPPGVLPMTEGGWRRQATAEKNAVCAR